MTAPPPDQWSEPRIYGAMPVPGDASLLAVATAEAREPADTWSTPSYHGPRRWRPRPAPVANLIEDTSLASPDEPLDLPNFESEVLTDSGVLTDSANLGHPAAVADSQPEAEPAAPGLLASSRTMAVASLVSRATGFLRTIVLAAALGSGLHGVAEAYNLANTLPNMVYELLLGGVLTSVVIPILVKAQQDDRDRGIAYTQRLLSIATASLGGATLLAVLAAPWLIAFFGGPHNFQSVATLWATLLLPEIFFYGLGAMFAAVLNTRHIYGWPAWAPVLNNLITIAAVGLFVLVPGPSALATATITNTQILVLGIGTTLGIVAQAVVLIVPLRRSGFHWQWRFRASAGETGRMSEFRTLTLWVLAYVAISQVGVIAINRVAINEGGVTIFAYADLLFQVPYGILGVSLLTALMPRMSRAAARGDTEEVLDDLRLGTRLSAVALVPISAGLIVFGPSFTSVILLGRFTLDQARLTGTALAVGAFGLLPFALVMLQQRVFYALRDARTPAMINLSMVFTKVLLVLAAGALWDGRAVIIALTASTSLSYVVGCVAGHLLLTRRFGGLGFRTVTRTVGYIAVAAVAGAIVGLLLVLLADSVLGVGRASALVGLVLGGGLGSVVMWTVANRLPLPEVKQIAAAVRSR